MVVRVCCVVLCRAVVGTADPRFPDRGVQLTYSAGDSAGCRDAQGNAILRTMNLFFRCSADATNVFDDEVIIERSNCIYDIYLTSLYGCPTQCIKGGTLCSGKGVCGYDSDAHSARCFCNTGYEGDSCNVATPPPPGITVEGIFLIIMVLLLVGVMALTAFMLLKLRRLQVDPSAYGELAGRFNELGQIA